MKIVGRIIKKYQGHKAEKFDIKHQLYFKNPSQFKFKTLMQCILGRLLNFFPRKQISYPFMSQI